MKLVSHYQQLSAWSLGVHDTPDRVLDDGLARAIFGAVFALDDLLARDSRADLLVEKAPGRPVVGLAGP